MEGLHIAMEDTKEVGLFSGVQVGGDNFCITHLFYADDVIFLGDWAKSNICNIFRILHCFYLVLGLNINMHKSNIDGVSIPFEEVKHLDFLVGCKVDKVPFTYFEASCGENMSRVIGWKSVKEKF